MLPCNTTQDNFRPVKFRYQIMFNVEALHNTVHSLCCYEVLMLVQLDNNLHFTDSKRISVDVLKYT